MKKIALVYVLALASASAFADVRSDDKHDEGQGFSYAQSFRGLTSVSIAGEAARVLYDNMKGAKEESRRLGSLLSVTRKSKNLECTFEAEVALNYECQFHVDTNGEVEPGVVYYPARN